jgi:hypothetical protein
VPPFVLLLCPAPPPGFGRVVPWGDGWAFYPELEKPLAELAQQLSGAQGCVALGVACAEEALRLWVFAQGQLVFQYDSNPMHLACPVCSYSEDSVGPEMGDVEALCRLFGLKEARPLKSWLRRKKGLGFLSEKERFEKVLELLGLPKGPSRLEAQGAPQAPQGHRTHPR